MGAERHIAREFYDDATAAFYIYMLYGDREKAYIEEYWRAIY